jgi:hypothetical protein
MTVAAAAPNLIVSRLMTFLSRAMRLLIRAISQVVENGAQGTPALAARAVTP